MSDGFAQDVQNFREALHAFDIYSIPLMDDFADMLLEEASPRKYYKYMASGSYKECYRLNENFIIKFASVENETAEEMRILKEAEKENLSQIFLPTQHVSLTSCTLPTFYLADEDSEDIYLTDVLLQPFCHETARGNQSYLNTYNESLYMQNPIFDKNNEQVPFSIARDIDISCRDWIQDTVNIYGIDFLKQLKDFILKYGISDLRPDNIGWLREGEVEYPVILDWLSD